MGKKTAKQLDDDIAAVLAKPRRSGARKKKLSEDEIRTKRLKSLRSEMAGAEGDEGWADADLDRIAGFAYVSEDLTDDLSDDEWERIAMRNIQDQSVTPEHVGAPPPNVYAWNDIFISTYRMNIEDGMSERDAIDSARQNANDTVELTVHERAQTKMDPKLYPKGYGD